MSSPSPDPGIHLRSRSYRRRPEASLIALDSGLAVCAVCLARRPTPPQTTTVVAATGSR
jgi:hypothetical protein